MRVLLPTAAVGASLYAAGNGWGLINYLESAAIGRCARSAFSPSISSIYAQHVVFHKVPVLWRLHRMHHADLDIDVTTGVRFHPIEILISLLIKIAVIVALGIPVVAVILFEVVLNVSSMFNHSNVSMPAWLDRVLRLVLVTPDMHRVHHSILRHETDSNFGFNLPWWDRLFGTYRAQPEPGQLAMTIGIPAFRDPGELRIDRMITQPFRNANPEPFAHLSSTTRCAPAASKLWLCVSHNPLEAAMAGVLRVKGTIDLAQFWPDGESDADTTKIKVEVGANSFSFAADGKTFKTTQAYFGTVVRGASSDPVIDKQGRITVRLQGIDAPELHYRARRTQAEFRRLEGEAQEVQRPQQDRAASVLGRNRHRRALQEAAKRSARRHFRCEHAVADRCAGRSDRYLWTLRRQHLCRSRISRPTSMCGSPARGGSIRPTTRR